MRSEKGITLTSLVIYIAAFMLILATMALISNYFFKNISTVKEPLKYVTEFNKFSMVFVQDVKNNDSCTVTDNMIEFKDGTVYSYSGNIIYRNGVKIAKHIKNLKFTSLTYNVDTVTKNMVNVEMTLGQKNEQITRNIDFVLKYW